MTQIAELPTDKTFSAKVIESKRLTPDDAEEIREITMQIEDNGFNPEIDQSFGVLIESTGEFGNYKHHRLYSVADLPEKKAGKTIIKILVKRCSYIDDFNGEVYEGVASNYLCDRKKGDLITLTGPHGLPFDIPNDKATNLILIGMGTGIAPFRAFIKHLYTKHSRWEGKILLFYGARSGLELLYLNEEDNDLSQYYDEKTFEAFHALSPRPHMNDPIALDDAIMQRAEEIYEMLNKTNTRIYIAGYKKVKEKLDETFTRIMGSENDWFTRKAELIAGNKWAEIVY